MLWTGGNIEIFHIPILKRNDSIISTGKENKSKASIKKTRPPKPHTPMKLDGQRTSPTRMKLISKALNFNADDVDFNHSRSKSHFVTSAADLHF